jgi:hypothetical protein
MAQNTQEYLQYAQECARWALEAPNEQDKQVLLDMAKDWTVAALAPQNAKPPAPETAVKTAG